MMPRRPRPCGAGGTVDPRAVWKGSAACPLATADSRRAASSAVILASGSLTSSPSITGASAPARVNGSGSWYMTAASVASA